MCSCIRLAVVMISLHSTKNPKTYTYKRDIKRKKRKGRDGRREGGREVKRKERKERNI